MAQKTPRVARKAFGGQQTVDWVDPVELTRFLNLLENRVVDLEAKVAALEALNTP